MKIKSWIFCAYALCAMTPAGVWAAAPNANVQKCIDKFAPELSTVLQTATLDVNSPTLADDVAKISKPVVKNILRSDSDCLAVRNDLKNYRGAQFSVEFPPNIVFDMELDFDNKNPIHKIDVPEQLESLLPWYGILVVKKGSLDNYANADVPIISSEYMKNNRAAFFPDNSDKPLGMWRGCTHGNHTANDNDVVNRAAHITADEPDSFWSGNDFYVYDGEDVYWGTAQLVGEIALALITLGASAEVSASKAAAQSAVATDRAVKAQRAITLAKRAEKLKNIESAAKKAGDAAKVAKAQRLGLETRQAARLALEEAGAGPVSALTNTSALGNMGRLLEASGVAAEKTAATKPLTWVSALSKPWRLVKPGLQTLKPKNIASLYGKGVPWAQRIKRAAITAGGVGIGTALLQAFGYSSAAVDNYASGVRFNSFGLLSADDLEGRENEVSHGAWLMFEESGEVNEGDAMNEAMAWAEDFTNQLKTINSQDPQCDIDIYVVQPGISNPAKLGTREIYYTIMNPAGSLRVSTK